MGHIEGFSRATEISWSLYGQKPFLEINLGPSVVKNHATADRVNFYTPSFRAIDWQNIALYMNVESLVLNSFSKVNSLNLSGNLNLESEKVSNIYIEAVEFSTEDHSLNSSAHLITGDISQLIYNEPLNEQSFSSTFAIENIMVSEPNLNLPEAMVEISVQEGIKNFKIDLHDVQLSESGGSIEKLEVDGHFDQLDTLHELNISSTDSIPFKKSPKFPEILASIKRSGDEQYEVNIEGILEEFELSDSDNFIGLLPSGDFVVELEVDRTVSTMTSMSKINFNTSNLTDISGSVEMGFTSEILTNLGCAFSDCKLSDFNLFYNINLDEEWVRGRANCPTSLCSITEMNHLVRTSNTANIFTTLNQANILSPLASLYLFGSLSSGQKIDEGHELKFQF